MIRIHLRAADLAETSFVISPMQETVGSLWVWSRPARQPFHLPWRRAMLPRRQAADVEALDALTAPVTGWIPDFLTPRPAGPDPDFASELAAIAATPWRTVRADLERAYGEHDLPPVLRQRPTAVRDRIVAALAGYHRLCIEPHWPRIRAVLEGDVAYRGRQLANSGARGLFGDLDALVRWDDGHLYVDRLPGEEHHVEVGGRGLPLVPSLFVRGAITYVNPAEAPIVVYPARGRAAVWERTHPPAAAALVELIGRPRARLLVLLREPASTTELARRLGVTPSSVSHHLKALRAARLVSRTRSGRSVLYLRSELADALMGARPTG